MTVPNSPWRRYIDLLHEINNAAAITFSHFVENFDTTNPDYRKALIDMAVSLAQKYSESSAAVACEMYDAIAAASGVSVSPAVPAPVPTYGEVAKTVNGMIKQHQGPDAMGAAVGRLVKRTGVDTVLENGIRDGAEFAWIPSGDTCPFCMMLASNGWQRISKKALKKGHAEHIHANCDCTYGVRFGEDTRYASYDEEEYQKIWDETPGETWQEKLDYLQRKYREEHRTEKNARSRELYELHKKRTEKTDSRANNASFVSVYNEYRETADPGNGKLTIEDERKPKNREKANADLIHQEFGGDLILQKERYVPGAQNPDYIWRGKLWEEQEPKAHTKNAIDANVREAIHQIAENPGGIVLDVGNSKMPLDDIKSTTMRRLRRSSPYDCDVVIIRNGKIEDVFRFQKK